MKRTNVIIGGVRLLLFLTFLGALIGGIRLALLDHASTGSYFMASFTAILSVGLTYIPDFIAYKDIMAIPAALQTFFTVFTFLAMFFGEILRFYDRFSWWDSMLHFSSGIMFSFVGFILFVSLNRDSSIRRMLNPISVIMFAFCFSLACGAIWEIFEFAGDSLLGMNMQRWQSTLTPEQWAAMQNTSNLSNSGLMDTMKDIITDTLGAILACVLLLPLIKRDNHYTKPDISCDNLLEQSGNLNITSFSHSGSKK